ncbi:hypothetical protein ACMA1D_02145 [Streptomyces sp. 796.1]|uniref:hypothetical protein n=1 Tax=Streptomyces sp. 796.1 TaxID=3163029 RepID=UPI0039C9FBAF
MTHTHVVMWSGGATSYATARLVADRYGTDNLVLLFADTRYEDPDLYRWNAEASALIGVPLTVVADGRDPWQVFNDKLVVGNARIAPCSQLLKQIPSRTWLEARCDPASTTIYIGIDWSETHRLPAIRFGYAHTLAGCAPGKFRKRLCADLFANVEGPDASHGRRSGPGCRNLLPVPWHVEAPLAGPPYLDKEDILQQAEGAGVRRPELYAQGFVHNNCGGRCVRGGQAQWVHLLRTMPERYAEVEQQEEALRARLRERHGGDVAILRDRRRGKTVPLTLTELRRRAERRGEQDGLFDTADWGGCGCLPGGDAA